jgi:acetyl esterase/lipase
LLATALQDASCPAKIFGGRCGAARIVFLKFFILLLTLLWTTASVADGKTAIRWVRQHAAELGVDPQRIVAAGASAGGQVAAAAGIVSGMEEAGEDFSVSSKPDALLLWYVVVDNGPDGYGPPEMKARFKEISPLHNLTSNAPPTLFLLGTKDKLIPVATAEEFKRSVEQGGKRCELKLFPGAGHPIYEWRKGASPLRAEALAAADEFLARINCVSSPAWR